VRVVVHPADQGGCGNYRLIFPAQALANEGEDVCLEFDYKYSAYWQDTAWRQSIIGMAQPVDADVVVLQRPLHRHRYELMRALQADGVAVVVEVDDDFHAVHKANVAWRSTNPLVDPDHNRDWLMRACKEADLVTVSTPALAERYGAHGRVVVLPNYVPARYCDLEPPVRAMGTVVGWTGSVATHPGDLEVTGGAVQRVLDETDARFHVVGTGAGVVQRLGLDEEPSSTGWVPLDTYPVEMAQIDVGIVPLAPHPFNEAKSWLKGLEFAALGVPFVATPTSQYQALHGQYGLGELAATPVEWGLHLRRLLAWPVLRCEEAERGRDMVRANLTVEANAWRWEEAWAQAVENAKVRVPA
jgi:glycosyltransferase involved in cell wall biosynthesis